MHRIILQVGRVIFRRSSMAFGLILVLAIGCKENNTVKAPEPPKPPNVLFIAVDDLNNYLKYLGDPNAITPNFDKLASAGTIFSNAHCQAPLCGPSRASLLTGLRPSTTGIYGMIKDDSINTESPLLKENILLPEYFKQQGYTTYGVGKIFHDFAPKNVFEVSGGRFSGPKPNHNFGPKPEKRMVWEGYAERHPEKYGRTSTDWGAFPEKDSMMPDYQNTKWVIKQLEQHGSNTPFFMALGYLRPHVPLHVPQKWFDLYPLDSLETPPYLKNDFDDIPDIAKNEVAYLPMMPTTDWAIETDNWKKILQAYLACVSFVDHEIGKVLNALENSRHAENTVIVLWSDHGYRIGEKGSFAKQALWEEATRTPLIFSGPNIPLGKNIDAPVELLSMYPTLLELCGLPPNETNEGISLVPLLKGDSNGDLNALTTYGYKNHSVRTDKFRYIRYEDGSEELYDMEKDPNQFENLADVKRYHSVKEAHREKLPTVNSKWHKHSNYTFQAYFVEQKMRVNNEGED
ncbi:MAG: sulfatase [Pricia sp.]